MTWPNCRGRALPLQRFALISGGNLTKSRIMKVAIPGRAIKMQELNESGGSGQAMNPLLRHGKVPFNDIRIRPAIDYLSPSAQASNSVGDAPHIGHRDWNRTAKLYRKELKAKGNARPSTAVRQHVKKISEEFAMTQTKFENSVNTVGAAKTLDARGKFPPSLASPAPLASRYPQSTKVARGVFSKITCSKCESITKASRKGALAPSAASPAGAACKDSKGHVSKSQGGKGKGSGAAAAAAAAASPQKKVSASLSPPGSRPRQRHQSGRGGGGVPDLGLAPSSPAAQPRSPVRKTSSSSSSSSALGGVSPRSKQMSSEQIKKVKVFTEKAIMEGRVFSTFGYFPAIKDALRRRGWVEKIQHTVPYVNPHPNNCVCPHVGYQVTSLPLPNSQQPPGRAGSSPTAAAATATAASRSAQERAGDESSPPAGDDGAAAGEGQALRSGASPSAPSPPPPPPPSSGKSSPAEGQDAAITASTGSSSVESLAPRQDRGSVDSAPGDAENRSSSDCQSRATGRSSSIAEEPCDSSPTGLPGNSGRLNTAILGPSEIRRGIAEAINEKNATIFRYSTIHVPKRRTHNDSKAVDSEKAVEAKENPEETSVEGEEEGEEEAPAPADEEEAKANPEPYNPYVDYELCDMDLPLVARLLRNVEPNFLWTWTRDSISFKHLSREQVVNRFPNTPFTTKYGLCETLQQLHWFSEAASVETFVPRGYCIGHEDERTAFIHDYRLTACLNVLKWITERRDTHGPQAVADPHGEVPTKRVRQALVHVEQFIQSCCHDDLDSPPPTSLRDHEWDALLAAHYKIVHMDKKIKVATPAQLQALVSDCESALQRAVPHWPQLAMDGLRNLWIVKPGAQSRGRGIFMMNHLEEILALVQSPLIYETKYVVQKYMERPMLIHNTKFDIRQWFLVTDWNPLHVWVYKECYLRFCSQQYDLSNNNEAVHLSNNAIQCKYLNGERSGELPEENMWDCDQFKDYLRGLKKERTWEEVIYPGMRDALVAAMLAAQVEMDTFKHGFELFGADFMLTEDLKPWLIEINSSPCMAPTTSVTRRMCANCLQDVIKVVVDYKQNKTADTGLFELAYRDSERSVPNPPYLGVNLQVVGRQIKKGPMKTEKRKAKKARPAVRLVKPLPLITLSLEEGAHYPPKDPPRDTSDILARNCSILDCRRYASGGIASLALTPTAEPLQGTENESNKTRSIIEGAGEGNPFRQDFPELSNPTGECGRSNTKDGPGGKPGSAIGSQVKYSGGKTSVATTHLDCRGS